MDEILNEHGEYLTLKLGEALTGFTISYGELTLNARRGDIVEIIRVLRDDAQCRYISIIDICGVDYPGRAERFDVVYHLLSPTQNIRLRVRVTTDETTPVPSVTGVFPGANWYEREAYDLYGILFSGHPDLRRLLTDYGFEGHPLRKDFPVSGFVEVRFDEEQRRVVYEPVKLTQEYRDFDYLSPWEGTEYVLPGDEKASNNG
ncbi:MAG: NADH-quinone oxidoreductase subunit C [Alphaproteobacteria bacterium]|nr:NADH-quinone oxidoreductase subunit C [Alphaproteobacteria bacterium]